MFTIINYRKCFTVIIFLYAVVLVLTAVQAQTTTETELLNNTVYEILVRSFYDSNGDGVGDINGLTQKLDYLNDGNPQTDGDLEIGVIWLMPIFPSVSYHGYDVNNYCEIHPEYGTLADFDRLIIAAHERGVRIILDIPFNHTSKQHLWFKDAFKNPSTSRYRDYYYLVVGNAPHGNGWHWDINDSGQRVYYFGDFGYEMPDLNFSNVMVKDEVKKTAKFWLDRGVDGFRLDAAKHIFSWSDNLSWEDIQRNNAWWREFSDYVYSIKPSSIIVGEVLDSQQMIHHFAWGLNGLLDPHFMHEVREFTKSPYTGLIEWWKHYLTHARENNANFDLFPYVSSHDENPRLASFVKEHVPQRSEQVYRLAMYLLLTVGKYPILYYGDEVMQKGWKWKGDASPKGDGSGVYDETLREPFPWYRAGTGTGQTRWFAPRFDQPNDGVSVEEQSASNSMLSIVRSLTNFRAENQDFANGEIGKILNDTDNWIVFEKGSGSATYLTMINTSHRGYDYEFNEQWYDEYKNARLLYWSDGVSKKWEDTSEQQRQIRGSVYVPPVGFVILKKP